MIHDLEEKRRNKEALAALRGGSNFWGFYSWGLSAVNGSTRQKGQKGTSGMGDVLR